MKHRALAVLCAVALSGSLFAGLTACSQSGTPAYVQSVGLICGVGSTVNADRFAGVVETKTEAKIQKDADKDVQEVLVSVGDMVEAGQVLFTYDKETLALSVEKAALEIEQLKTSIQTKEDQRAALQRQANRASGDTLLALKVQIQELTIDITEAKFSLVAKEKAWEAAAALLENAEVCSPIAGKVRAVNTPEAADQDQNHVLIVVTEVGDYRVKGYINETNMGALYPGMPVLVRSRVDDTVLTGVVERIDFDSPVSNGNDKWGAVSDDTQSSSKYPFYVSLDSSAGLIIGQHVYIEPDFGQAGAGGALLLPVYYVNDLYDNPWVWAESASGKLEKRSLTLGVIDEMAGIAEVLDGLTAADYIAFPEEGLKSGMRCEEYDLYGGGFGVDDGGVWIDDGWMGDDGVFYDDGVDGEGSDGSDAGKFDVVPDKGEVVDKPAPMPAPANGGAAVAVAR